MEPGGCAGGRCADTLLRRHVPVPEPGEGLQPAGRLLPARAGPAPGSVSACMAGAKLTPCAQRGAGDGCSLRCKGVGSAGELRRGRGCITPPASAVVPVQHAGARPGYPLSFGLPERQRRRRRCGGSGIPFGGCHPPNPLPTHTNPTGAARGRQPGFPHGSHAAGEIRAHPSAGEGHRGATDGVTATGVPGPTQPLRGRGSPSQRLCTGSHHSAARRLCRHSPGLRQQSPRHRAGGSQVNRGSGGEGADGREIKANDISAGTGAHPGELFREGPGRLRG